MKLLVIDGNSFVNRAFYGVGQGLTNSLGEPTGGIYGFFNMMNKLIKEHKPDGLCVTFDRREPTFRHLSYPDYKGTRKKTPDELLWQLSKLRELLKAMNTVSIDLAGWEADDLLGTISRICDGKGWETILATGDKDALQLITEKTKVAYAGNSGSILFDEAKFEEKYGFPPIHLVDLKAFMGDSSDNIPGIKGVGEKTITPVIQMYHTVDAIYEKLEEDETETLGLKPAGLSKVRNGKESAILSHDLARIRTDAPIEFDPKDTVIQEPDHKELFRLLSQLELNKLIDLYGLQSFQCSEEDAVGVYQFEEVSTLEKAREVLEQYRGQRVSVLALDELTGVTLCHTVENVSQVTVFRESVLVDYSTFLGELFTFDVEIATFESKHLHSQLLQEGISATNIIFDVEVAAYLLSPEEKEYTLEGLGKNHLKYNPPSEKLYKDKESFSPLSDVAGAVKAWVAHTVLLGKLTSLLGEKLETLGLHTLFQDIELPLCKILAKMEHKGICLHKEALVEYGSKIEVRLKELEQGIYQEAGEEFNIASPKQLGEILFENMELPHGKKTKTGYSTNMEVLEELRESHPDYPILGMVLEHRHLAKLHSTYVKGLLKQLRPTGRIHTTLKNTVTATGRLSSTEPNLQNIPIRTKLGEELRYMFVAEKGNVLVDADYSQIELRLLAHLSGDETMIAAFQSGEDFHKETASRVFGVPLEDVTSEMRRSAKAVNFGIIYGMSAYSLSQDIGVTVYEAQAYMKSYFETYPKVEEFMKKVVEEGQVQGYVSTLYGRKRWIPELKSSNGIRRNAAERIAQNMPMQGTAADLMKLAMIAVDKVLEAHPQVEMVLQIHDEILIECPEELGEELTGMLEETMSKVAEFAVPLLVEGKCAKSWGEAH